MSITSMAAVSLSERKQSCHSYLSLGHIHTQVLQRAVCRGYHETEAECCSPLWPEEHELCPVQCVGYDLNEHKLGYLKGLSFLLWICVAIRITCGGPSLGTITSWLVVIGEKPFSIMVPWLWNLPPMEAAWLHYYALLRGAWRWIYIQIGF